MFAENVASSNAAEERPSSPKGPAWPGYPGNPYPVCLGRHSRERTSPRRIVSQGGIEAGFGAVSPDERVPADHAPATATSFKGVTGETSLTESSFSR